MAIHCFSMATLAASRKVTAGTIHVGAVVEDEERNLHRYVEQYDGRGDDEWRWHPEELLGLCVPQLEEVEVGPH